MKKLLLLTTLLISPALCAADNNLPEDQSTQNINCNLDLLPDELKIQIMEHVVSDAINNDRRETIVSICQVNREFNQIVQMLCPKFQLAYLNRLLDLALTHPIEERVQYLPMVKKIAEGIKYTLIKDPALADDVLFLGGLLGELSGAQTPEEAEIFAVPYIKHAIMLNSENAIKHCQNSSQPHLYT